MNRETLEHLDALARARRATKPAMTHAQAFAEILDEQPDLYARSLTAPDDEPAAPPAPSTVGEPEAGPASTRKVRQEIERQVQAKRAAKPALSHAQAYSEVMDEEPWLYALDLREARDHARG